MRNINGNQELKNENAALRRELISLDRRLSAIERSIIFRILQRVGRVAESLKRRAGKTLLASPFHRLYANFGRHPIQQKQYAAWLETHRASDPLAGPHIAREQAMIRFSIILPTKSPNLEWLRQAVQSVQNQTWPNWELCIGEDGEMTSPVRDWLDALARTDPRIVLSRGGPPGISATLNRGLAAAAGDYVAFLDHDDVLEPTALAHVAGRLSANDLDLIYTDEDYIGANGQPLRPNFKPDWSPELLLTCMYMGHLIVARRRLVVDIGGFDAGTDGSQDFDLVLRLIDNGARVDHVARVLYHWRSHEGSTAHSPAAKPHTLPAGKRVLAASLHRRHIDADVSYGERPNTYRVRPSLHKHDLTLVIPSRDPALLRRCLKAVRDKTSLWENLRLVVVHHETEPVANAAMRQVIGDFGAAVVPFSGAFHFARMMNEGAKAAQGDLLVFLNDDVEPVGSEWLLNLTSPLLNSDIGVTGARLLYPNGTIQHAGIVLGMGDATGHCGRFLFDSSWWPWINHTRDISAVTGACLATTTQLFRALSGFDDSFPNNYNDVDYCLRARGAGFRTVIVNDAVLIHHEGLSRVPGTNFAERLVFFRRWGHLLENPDPFFTPHLRLDREDLSLNP